MSDKPDKTNDLGMVPKRLPDGTYSKRNRVPAPISSVKWPNEISKARAIMWYQVKDDDIAAVTKKLIAQARAGDLKAATLFFDLLGLRVKQVHATLEGPATKLYVGIDIDKV